MKLRAWSYLVVLSAGIPAVLVSSHTGADRPSMPEQVARHAANESQPSLVACSAGAHASLGFTTDSSVGTRATPEQPIHLNASLNGIGPVPDDICSRLPHLANTERWRLNYFCPADINRDDQVDGEDVALFLEVWGTQSGSLPLLLDINRDGVVDRDDADAFFRAFGSGECDPAEAREHRLVSC